MPIQFMLQQLGKLLMYFTNHLQIITFHSDKNLKLILLFVFLLPTAYLFYCVTGTAAQSVVTKWSGTHHLSDFPQAEQICNSYKTCLTLRQTQADEV